MKSLIYILFLALTPTSDYGQEINQIFTALGGGDVNFLADYLHPRAEVHVMDRISVYDKKAAIKVLTKFYSEYDPVSYKRIHKGSSKAQNSLYSIGSLTTKEGNFRVYLYVRKVKDKILIEELRFDKDS